MRRLLLAMTVSFAVHLLVVAGAVGVGAWQAMSLVPAVKLQPISVEVNEIPLGPAPAKAEEPEDEPKPRAPRPPRRRAPTSHEGVTIASTPDAGTEPSRPDARPAGRAIDGGAGGIDGGRRRPGDLREHSPAGSRLNAVLRLDRIRASAGGEATIAAIDQLLVMLPDRRRLIEGSGLDLYRDFDSLIIGTPNPMDDAVTFLAVRHHLSENALKAGLDRAAKAARKPIEWTTKAGRPVGIRRRAENAGQDLLDRDDRILALPKSSLAVIMTPAYAGLVLGDGQNKKPGIDAGAPDAGAAAPRKPTPPLRWQTWVDLIEGAENDVPDDAAFMMMATGLFAAVEPPTGYVVPPTRGASDDQPPQPVGPAPPPTTLVVLAGVEQPYVDVSAEFGTAEDAERWERDLPAWRRKLVTNPVVILSGFASMIARVTSSREDNVVHLRLETTTEEIQRLLNLAVTLTRTAMSSRR